MNENCDSIEPRNRTKYGYDAANRLNSATESGSGSGWNQAFTYDQYGNQEMTQTPLDLGPITLHCPSYNGTNNRCTGAFQYDNGVAGGPGNITAFPGDRTALYDAESRQTTLTEVNSGVTSTSQYFYDGEGRRVKKVGGTRTVLYVYDGMGQLAAEYDSAPPEAAPCATCYLTVDHLGSTRLMTDALGAPQRRYDYLPFGWGIQSGYGNRSTVAGYVVSDKANPKFTGKERDYESGLNLDYFGARYFSAAQGRWTIPDWSAAPQPVPYADLRDPQTLNLYAYVRGNPLRLGDPDGHGIWDWVWTVRSGGKKIPPPPKKPSAPPAPVHPSAPVFPTVDAAAAAGARADQAKTKEDGFEYASSLYKIGPAYTYTKPITQRKTDTVDPNNPTGFYTPITADYKNAPIPRGTQLMGETHSHPDNGFYSGWDVQRAEQMLLPYYKHPLYQGLYLGLPNNEVWKWDGRAGKPTLVSPGDPH